MKFEKEKEEEKETIFNVSKFNEQVNKQGTSINTELFKKHFKIQRPSLCSSIYTNQMIERKTMTQ